MGFFIAFFALINIYSWKINNILYLKDILSVPKKNFVNIKNKFCILYFVIGEKFCILYILYFVNCSRFLDKNTGWYKNFRYYIHDSWTKSEKVLILAAFTKKDWIICKNVLIIYQKNKNMDESSKRNKNKYIYNIRK